MCKKCEQLEKKLNKALSVIKSLGDSPTARIDARLWSEYFDKKKKK
jgi:hypothetical protein